MLGTFVSKTIPRSAKAVCSCTILCLNLKTVNCTRRGLWDRLFGQGFDSPHLHQQVIESQRCDSFFIGLKSGHDGNFSVTDQIYLMIYKLTEYIYI